MHRFSVIVPMLGDQRLFDDTLASVLRYRAANSQIVVVHDEAFKDTYGLEGEVTFVPCSRQSASANAQASLVELFNEGLLHSKSEFVALVRPGVELDENWDESVEAAFENKQVGCVTPMIVTPAKPNTIVAAGVKKGIGFRRKTSGLNSRIAPRTIKRLRSIGPTSWAAFYRASALDQIGFCGEQLDDLYLDLDIALSLKTLGFQNVICGECVALIERAKLIENELICPHGKSAQRAYRRHEHQSGTGSPLVASASVFASEVISALAQPWKIRHAFQRLSARRLIEMDLDYADQLDARVEQILRIEESGIAVHDAPSKSSFEGGSTSDRRAA